MNLPESPITERERQFSEDLKNIIIEAMDHPMETEIETSLDFHAPNGVHETEIIEDNRDEEWYLQRYLRPESHQDICTEDIEELDYDYKKRAVDYWRSGKDGNRQLSSVKSKFKKVSSVRQLRRWAHNINQGGTYKEKLTKIAQYTLNNFMDALNKNLPIHDMDIRRWALRAREITEMPADRFKASDTWVREFKNRHRIVSRKITKYVTRKQLSDTESLQKSAAEFIELVKTHMTTVGAENTFNSDQSGFNLELHTGRTLAIEGQKLVESTVQSKMSTTHSYTVQPLISASGKLLSPLLIVLNEPTGKFGPRVEKTMFRPENIFLLPSKSGKLTTDHFKRWFQEVYIPNVGPKSIVLLDSWSGQCPTAFREMDMHGKDIKVLTIPAGKYDILIIPEGTYYV